ncbi:unnamed protein product [Urochloa humidicola]
MKKVPVSDARCVEAEQGKCAELVARAPERLHFPLVGGWPCKAYSVMLVHVRSKGAVRFQVSGMACRPLCPAPISCGCSNEASLKVCPASQAMVAADFCCSMSHCSS